MTRRGSITTAGSEIESLRANHYSSTILKSVLITKAPSEDKVDRS